MSEDRNELMKEYKQLTKELYKYRGLANVIEFELREIERQLCLCDNAMTPIRCY